ncbi:hypothetical protein [Streptomyces sp. H27-C3]|uniref:hypothetical protein n=1 Tax=Streptomyces sp. H27-C3 TaxID=3046305 RepID=UPI0024B87887|nr:hypothetical protein [Streptomyces sp. H27-C3]MDJ0463954.1 hypothetical protein [Streptomyces sp. H27-C3]
MTTCAKTGFLTAEYKINSLAPTIGDAIEAVGYVLKSGRAPTVCQLEVCGFQDSRRTVVGNGWPTLIRLNTPEQ